MTAENAQIPRQLPGLDRDNHAFWTSGAEGRLLIARCATCRLWLHPPLPHCPRCGSTEVAFEPVSGRGRVASFTINAQPWMPGLPVPYIFAAVELEEQAELYVFTNIINCDAAMMSAGTPVVVEFERRGEIYLPLFAPERPGV